MSSADVRVRFCGGGVGGRRVATFVRSPGLSTVRRYCSMIMRAFISSALFLSLKNGGGFLPGPDDFFSFLELSWGLSIWETVSGESEGRTVVV